MRCDCGAHKGDWQKKQTNAAQNKAGVGKIEVVSSCLGCPRLMLSAA